MPSYYLYEEQKKRMMTSAKEFRLILSVCSAHGKEIKDEEVPACMKTKLVALDRIELSCLVWLLQKIVRKSQHNKKFHAYVKLNIKKPESTSNCIA